MKLATIFITSDRADLTEKTLRTFSKFNGWGVYAPFDTIWLHGDDASSSRENRDLAQAYGYRSVVNTKPNKRLGAHAMRRTMIDEAIERDATHVLVLENDWESTREMPWTAIDEAFRRDDVWAFRLYGEHKQKDGTRPAGHLHAGRDCANPHWKSLALGNERCQIGDIHFGAPPCVFEINALRSIHEGTKSDSAAMKRSGKIQLKTIRLIENVFWHIGFERTPGFRK